MFRHATELDAPRRVVSIQLLFGLLTVALLSAGIVQVVLAIQGHHVDSTCLVMFGKATPLVRADMKHNKGIRIQSLVEDLASDYALEYCAVVDPDNRFLANSNRSKLGQTAEDAVGSVEQWGDVVRISFVNDAKLPARMYRAPIRDGEQTVATLCAVVVDRGFWNTVFEVLDHGIWPILLGVACSTVGSAILWRTLRPLSAVERQLRFAATNDSSRWALDAVPATSVAAVGWNRIVEEGLKRSKGPGIESKVASGLAVHKERRAEVILQSLSDGIAMTDQEDRVTFSNAALAAILGLPEGQILGKPMDALLHISDSPNGARKLLESQFRSQQVIAEMPRDADGANGVLRVARSPIVNGCSGDPRAHVWAVRDITQQKLAEQMRNQFVYAATHELRTPLANIRAYAETLANADDVDVEMQKQFCNTINLEASRLARFIDDLLSISRMEAGALALQKHDADLARLFEEVLAKVRPEMVAKRITLEVVIPPKLPKLQLDKDKIMVALVNLLGNAAKYTPDEGRVSFEVEWLPDQLLMHVVDSGIGIAPEELPKVFDKFFRSQDPRVQDRTGSGLGLAIANEIVRLHGGRITAHSEINKGSKFSVSLPTS